MLILRRAILDSYRGPGESVPFVNRTFERGVAIATFLSVLSTVPRHCARLTYFLHPKLWKTNAVLPTLTQRRLRCASHSSHFPKRSKERDCTAIWSKPAAGHTHRLRHLCKRGPHRPLPRVRHTK